MSRGILFSKKEDETILDCISKNPTNIQSACKEASVILNRPHGSVVKRYYRTTRFTNKCFGILGQTGVYNTKNVKEGTFVRPEFVIRVNGIVCNNATITGIQITF